MAVIALTGAVAEVSIVAIGEVYFRYLYQLKTTC
jgi:hypothetical protein